LNVFQGWARQSKFLKALEKIMPHVKQINHVAVVVEDMDQALSFWRDALGLELHGLRDVPAEKSQVAFLPLPGSEVELVQPTTDDSGIAKYLAKRGPGMHHLCLEVDDIEGMMSQLKSKGVRLINEEPRLAADGKKYAFIHPESTSGVLVELYQI
jgi:methylmalonyl-CoA/ethylmalonyl-CoA epimerase